MPRRLPILLLATLPLAACNMALPSNLPTPIAAPAPVPQGQRDSRYEACRTEATRVVQYRERGQLMRTDETESSRGTLGVTPYSRIESDRGAAQIDRDRLIAECLSRAPTPPAATPATQPAPPAAPRRVR
ncbi:hypothetical protein ACLF3G_00305 [Falsiroseomonas sp. HC035]|uniref:hypothetical protein n=1 Tax=Falsiroseomonas sp. HC035 TaxID=3390999 RepID=UPI003D31FD83